MQRHYSVESSDSLWSASGNYYFQSPEDLLESPQLPDLSSIQPQRILALFERYGRLAPGRRLLELGCGASQWLPLLGQRLGCTVEGLELDPAAAELARANLRGAGVEGTIHAGDAFAPESHDGLTGRFDLVFSRGLLEHFSGPVECLEAARRYLRPDGILLTMVPNLRGLNGALQRYADMPRYRMHVVYDRDELAYVHRAAGLTIVAAGYVGVIDAYLTATTLDTPPRRRAVHARICRAMGIATKAFLIATRSRVAPELALLSPNVFVVARQAERRT